MSKHHELVGKRFGRLVVLSKERHNGRTKWNCQCDCGTIKSVIGSSLVLGHTKSCGCLIKEVTAKRNTYNAGKPRIPIKDKFIRSIMQDYKKSAEIRGLNFLLDSNNFEQLILDNCSYCQSEPSNKIIDKIGNTLYYNGIDRVDNTLGYVPDNCVTCCRICNWAKKDLSREEFFSWIKRVYNTVIG